MSMVERVARALAAELGPDTKDEDLRYVDVDGVLNLYEMARAAIEVMSGAVDDEDFLEQVHIGAYEGRFAKSGETYPVYRNFIRAFIDAALKE